MKELPDLGNGDDSLGAVVFRRSGPSQLLPESPLSQVPPLFLVCKAVKSEGEGRVS